MVILNLFIDYHYKSIVSIIRAKHVLTLHLSTANWRKLTGSCCKNAPAHYVILPDRVIPQFLELWSTFNALWWNANFTLLYRNATTFGIMPLPINLFTDWLWPFGCSMWWYHLISPKGERKISSHGLVNDELVLWVGVKCYWEY